MSVKMPEAVAEIMSGYVIVWAGTGPIAPLIERTGAQTGSLLITTDQAEAYANERVREALEELKGLADRAYCLYIENLRTPECLGWEHKVKTGKFGDMELKAHTKAAEFLGRHRAFSEAADAIRALLAR